MPTVTELPATQPLVSVKMITYNHRPYIERAITSILSQEVDFGVEFVIGEDCSTDGTREVVFDFQRRHPNHIRVVTSDRNVGMRANSDRTGRECRGKYLAYCEGDDYWHDRTKLAKQVGFLEAHPDYVMVHSHCDRYLVQQQRLLRNDLTVPRGLDDRRAYEDILLARRVPLTVTVLTRRDKAEWIKAHCPECTDSRWPMGDIQAWLELSRLGKIGCIHESLATTNVLPESAGQSRDPRKRLRFFKAARELQLHYLEKYPVATTVDRAVRQKLALVLLQYAYDAQDPETGEEMYRDFVAQRGHPTFRARWLRWGSRSPLQQRLVIPLVKAERKLRRFKRSPVSPAT